MKAIANLTHNKKGIEGVIFFEEIYENKCTKISIKIKGVTPGNHGFHIHEFGDLSEGCKSLGGHYNPHGKNHGSPLHKDRHIGDLGNLKANNKGEINKIIYDKKVKLRGKYSVIGRSVVLHEKEDDLGLGGTKESLTTGSAKARIACGIIGHHK